MSLIKKTYHSLVSPTLSRMGLELVKTTGYPADFLPIHREICDLVKPYTMTSPERLFSLVEAVQHVNRAGIQGAFVECGVWRGGSSMAMAETCLRGGVEDRDIHLFDTFAGMSEPTEKDLTVSGKSAVDVYEGTVKEEGVSDWCYSSLAEVKSNMARVKYPQDRVFFVEGKVEDTIPQSAPEQIALLRLDTDWYESTKHELEHLFPRLSPGGVLIIDDYGHWEGVREAVDEYFSHDDREPLLLNRVDYTGRIGIK